MSSVNSNYKSLKPFTINSDKKISCASAKNPDNILHKPSLIKVPSSTWQAYTKTQIRNVSEDNEINRFIRKNLDKSFKVIAFDWDGTAVQDRKDDATEISKTFIKLAKQGKHIIVITATNVNNVGKQILGPINSILNADNKLSTNDKKNILNKFKICTNRGSEVYGLSEEQGIIGTKKLYAKEATKKENALMDKIAIEVQDEIQKKTGFKVDIISNRLNRRKLDLIPECEKPDKAKLGELLNAVNNRLKNLEYKGSTGLEAAFNMTIDKAKELGLDNAKIVSDFKFIEFGLSDKSDSVKWIKNNVLEKENIDADKVLILGDEFGSINKNDPENPKFQGSDNYIKLHGACIVSVGSEPNGVPEGILNIKYGPKAFHKILQSQEKPENKE